MKIKNFNWNAYNWYSLTQKQQQQQQKSRLSKAIIVHNCKSEKKDIIRKATIEKSKQCLIQEML